jgi:Tfp pilus assembly protein PilF
MSLFARSEVYDRARILDAAERASARNRRRCAIRLYRRVLAVESGNPELHAKIAPLLARAGETFDAWYSFRQAARSFEREGLVERALHTYREAVRALPHEIGAWLSLAQVLRRSGHDRDALAVLLQGRCRLRGRRQRARAIHLLRRAREIEAWRPEIVLDLARLLARSDQAEEARSLLEALGRRCQGRELRRVRGAQWRLAPSLGHTWRWLRAVTGARSPEARASAARVRAARAARERRGARRRHVVHGPRLVRPGR